MNSEYVFMGALNPLILVFTHVKSYWICS